MVQNPTLYVLIGNARQIDIISLAEQTHPHGGAICLHLDEPMDNLIREVKASLQSCEISQLDAQRVNIYVVAIAHDPQATQLVPIVGERLQVIFAEDFAFHITLVVLFDESNESSRDGYKYEARTGATYEFLVSLTGETVFDCIFLLSNRNEFGRVSSADYDNTHRIMAFLPLLHCLESSRFNEIMNAKAGEAGRVLFASAGVGVGEPAPDVNRDNRVLHSFAQFIEHEMETHDASSGNAKQSINDGALFSSITSLPSKPLSFSEIFSLRGATIAEAEAIIFGDSAASFFNKNYPSPLCDSSFPNTLQLRDAVAEEKHLVTLIDETASEIAYLTNELSQKERTPVGFLHAIDNAKTIIGQIYATKYRITILKAVCKKYQTRHAQLHLFIQYIREVIATLKALPIQPPAQVPTEVLLSQARERAVLNISLLRHDGMLQESHVITDFSAPCVLRLIGGFCLEDLTRYHTMRSIVRPQANA